MSKEELEKEAEDKGIIYADSLKTGIKVEDGVEGYAWYQVEQAYEKGALDFAEPREKQIQIDAEQIRALQKDKGELTDENKVLKQNLEDSEIVNKSLTDRVANLEYQLEGRDNEIKELKAQIEKMKCCENCKNEGDYKEPYRYGTGWCNICKRHKVAKGNFDKWEIKEK